MGALGQFFNTCPKKVPDPEIRSQPHSGALSLPGICPGRETEQMLGFRAPETVVLPIGSKNIETLGWKITTGSISN